MRNGQLVFSAIQFLLIAALTSAGVGLIALDRSLYLRQTLADWISNPNTNLLLTGLLILAVAIILGVGFGAMQRGSFVRLKLQNGPFSVHESLVRKAVQQFWIENYPDEKRPSDVFVSHQKIEIVTPKMDQDLEEIERKLGDFFLKNIGYEQEFFLIYKV
ncbi:MAG: hypothetical protein P0S96_06750 [Simkaniaceae bacterium]|nr:hypothetical protein [Candidatus Sacchlamyda saccharinae]